jgi:hypothetical protein
MNEKVISLNRRTPEPNPTTQLCTKVFEFVIFWCFWGFLISRNKYKLSVNNSIANRPAVRDG